MCHALFTVANKGDCYFHQNNKGRDLFSQPLHAKQRYTGYYHCFSREIQISSGSKLERQSVRTVRYFVGQMLTSGSFNYINKPWFLMCPGCKRHHIQLQRDLMHSCSTCFEHSAIYIRVNGVKDDSFVVRLKNQMYGLVQGADSLCLDSHIALHYGLFLSQIFFFNTRHND